MKIKATDKTGHVHEGGGIKHLIVTEESGTPLIIIKEMIIGDLNNYKIFQPGDPEFLTLARTLGYEINITSIV